MYLAQGSSKTESFLNRLSIRLTGERRYAYSEPEDLYYLGGGYWRIKLAISEHRLWILINPSLRKEQIDTITAAMQILVGGMARTCEV